MKVQCFRSRWAVSCFLVQVDELLDLRVRKYGTVTAARHQLSLDGNYVGFRQGFAHENLGVHRSEVLSHAERCLLRKLTEQQRVIIATYRIGEVSSGGGVTA